MLVPGGMSRARSDPTLGRTHQKEDCDRNMGWFGAWEEKKQRNVAFPALLSSAP